MKGWNKKEIACAYGKGDVTVTAHPWHTTTH